MATKVATFRHLRPASPYFFCISCQPKRTHIVERDSFQAREFREDGQYSGSCIFKNVVNVLTVENQAAHNQHHIHCVLCNAILGSKYFQPPPLFANRRGPWYLVDMDTVLYWDGNNAQPAEAGLPAILAEAGQGLDDPLQDLGHGAQVQADGDQNNQALVQADGVQADGDQNNQALVQADNDPDDQGEDGIEAGGAWYFG